MGGDIQKILSDREKIFGARGEKWRQL